MPRWLIFVLAGLAAFRRRPLTSNVRRLKRMSALLRMSMKAVMVANALAGMNSSVSAETYEFRFWPAPSARKDPRFIEMHDGPCGQVATARVRTMPKYSSQEPLAPERVFEVDPRGKTLRSWNIPVDSKPYALMGTICSSPSMLRFIA